ncbi:MAG: hypothetical protein WDZ31_07150 [Phycisphaeraceae bacterium]
MGFEVVELYRPVLPAVWLVLLLAAAVVGAVWMEGLGGEGAVGRKRRVGVLGLRLVAIAGLGWLLSGPSVMDETAVERVGERGVTLLVDTSASMAEQDVTGRGGEAVSRWRALRAGWLSDESLARLREAGALRVVGFDERVRTLGTGTLDELEPDGRETRLFTAVEEAAADPAWGEAPPVLVVLSDGHDTQRGRDPAAVDRLVAQGATVHVAPVGSTDVSPGLAVQAWADADVLFEGQTTTVHAQVWPRGLGDREVAVTLHHEGEVVDQRRVAVREGAVAEPVAFEISPTAGGASQVALHGYEVRAEVVGDEATLPNEVDDAAARQFVFVQVSRERMRVLLLEGEPYWETRWLSRVLRDDGQVALDAVYHLGSERRIVQRAEEEADLDRLGAETLASYDVIVLGKRAERFFPGAAAQRLVDYVREAGGALVLARGRPFDVTTEAGREAMAVFDAIAPVTWGEQQVAGLALQLTEEGAGSALLGFDELADPEVLTTRLPGMLAATRIEDERAASVVLLRQTAEGEAGNAASPGMAAVVQARAGRGRVMAVLTDGLWQWALLPSALREHETVYHLFWSRAVRWLATGGEFLPGQDVSVTLDRLAVRPGEPVAVTVSTRYVSPDFTPRLRVTDPAGDTHTLTQQRDDARDTRFRATYRSEIAGVHRVEVDSPDSPNLIAPDAPLTARLAVEDRSPERLNPAARPDVLTEMAEATGGRRLALDDVDALLSDLQDRTLARDVDPQPRYVFARWPVLALIVGCLTLAWWLRRRAGLV